MKETPKPVGSHTAYENPVFLAATFNTLPEGVEIVGNGTLSHPLDVKLTREYAAAQDLLKAAALAVDQLDRAARIIADSVAPSMPEAKLAAAQTGLCAARHELNEAIAKAQLARHLPKHKGAVGVTNH